jgi:UDP-2,3-diacylglucosamine pyrophosphatase LpxH
MKKLKLVISDLHLGSGRTLEGGGTNSFEEFYFDAKLIEFFRYYNSGEYKDCEIELIINGDFLNFLQVDYRGHFLTVVTESVSIEKIRNIVGGHREVFAALREFAATPNRSVTYIVGNHDQCMLWPGTRAYLNEVLQTSIKFKNLVYFFDGIHVEHGHMHEAANRLDPKKFFLKKNLPEPILNLPFGSHFFVDFVLKLKQVHPHVDKVRPFKRMIRWALFNETIFTIKSFFALTKYFIDAVFKKDPRRQFPMKRILRVLAESAIFPDLSESARRILGDERVHTVIFGHTHVYQYRQWGADKEYFNTGTWTELTSLDIPSLGKITKLTFVLIEYPDDGGRPRGRLKEWRGYHRIEEDVAIS